MKFLIFAGLCMFIGSMALISANYYTVNIEKNGRVVPMEIVRLPKACIGTRVKYFVTYSYEGKLYQKATGGNFCERHYVGEIISMKFLEGSETILLPDESAITNLLTFAAIGLLGLGIAAAQWQKLRSYGKDRAH